MTRVTNGVATLKRRKRILKQTRGYFGNKSRLFRYANDAYWRAGAYAFRDRRKKKSEFRQLWIIRINAACRAAGISYSRLIHGLKNLHIDLNRKQLSELAIRNEAGFKTLIEQVLTSKPATSLTEEKAATKEKTPVCPKNAATTEKIRKKAVKKADTTHS